MPSLSKEAALVHEALVARGLETPLRPPVHEMDNETRKSLIACLLYTSDAADEL